MCTSLEQQVAGILGGQPFTGARPAPPTPTPAEPADSRTIDPRRVNRAATAQRIFDATAVETRIAFARRKAINTRVQVWSASALLEFCALHGIAPALLDGEAPAPGAGEGSEAEQLVRMMRALMAGAIDEAKVRAIASTIAGEVVDARFPDPRALRRMAEEAAKQAIEELAPRKVAIQLGDRPAIVLDDPMHAATPEVLMFAELRKPVLVVGPAGSGKSFLAHQVATILGLPFFSIACSVGMSEAALTGRLIPTGQGGTFVYHRSDFVKAFEEGGVFLLDEIDAADANVMLVLNDALANGRLPVPARVDCPVARRHPDFILIAAANTFGTGADRLYVGRNQLDESTLDRFRLAQIEIDYDADLEAKLCPDPTLLSTWRSIRQKVRENRMPRVVSMRSLKDAYDVRTRGGQSVDYCVEQLVKGWAADERTKVGLAREPRKNLFRVPQRPQRERGAA